MKDPSTSTFDPLLDGNLRNDLRLALLSTAPGIDYVWDEDEQRVRRAQFEGDRPILPKVSDAEMISWRIDFLVSIGVDTAHPNYEKLQEWASKRLARKALNSRTGKKWSYFLTEKLLELVSAWQLTFAKERLDPQDFLDVGDNLTAGECVFIGLQEDDESTREDKFAVACAIWASPRNLPIEIETIHDLVANLDRFVPERVASTVVHVAARFQDLGVTFPTGFNDVVFRLGDPIAEIYGYPLGSSAIENTRKAIAKTDNEYSNLLDCVDAFKRSTSVTAKGPSIALVKQLHSYGKVAIQLEMTILREIETLVGPVFRKFCEGCERRKPDAIASRRKELRDHLQRLEEFVNQESPGRLIAEVLNPVIEYVSRLVDDGTALGEAQTAPEIAFASDEVKLDLTDVEKGSVFLARLKNTGLGRANKVQINVPENSSGASLEFAEKHVQIDVEPGQERVVSFRLQADNPTDELTLPIILTCTSRNGATSTHSQSLRFIQQIGQPNWEELADNPPYVINPIQERQDLYGRDTVLNELSLHVNGRTSTFLWGQKRVGKTSVLQVLASELATNPDNTCLILRMGEIASLHEGEIAHTIAQRLAEAVGEFDPPKLEYFGAGMGRLVPVMEKFAKLAPSQRVTVIIDEFDDLDVAYYTGERGRQFIKAIRSLSEVGMTFFFVGSERMDAIYQDHASDLNKWTNVSLDRISSEGDCRALIEEPVHGAIEYAPEALARIVDYCRGNPFYLHLLCSALFKRCLQERRTYVSNSDLEAVRRSLLLELGPTNFAHFWEDNPVLDMRDKQRQSAENCLFLACISALGGHYESIEEIADVQRSLRLDASQSLSESEISTVVARMNRRALIQPSNRIDGATELSLPIFADWLTTNAEAQLLPIWIKHCEDMADAEDEFTPTQLQIDEPLFPIPEDYLLPIAERLTFLGKQIDVAQIRQWLRQFDDDNRIEIAFILLRRLATKGFVPYGASVALLSSMQDSLQAIRRDVGSGSWKVYRKRLDNLCITYVDSEVKSGAVTARELAKRMSPGKCSSIDTVPSWMEGHIDDDPILVFTDDFAGTGNTLVKGIKRCRELNPDIFDRFAAEGRIVCCLQSAFPDATARLAAEFPTIPAPVMQMFDAQVMALDEQAGIFEEPADIQFARDILLQIGRQLTPQRPLGFGDMGALVAFHNTTPNNSLPIFWASGEVNKKTWRPLLPRASFG